MRIRRILAVVLLLCMIAAASSGDGGATLIEQYAEPTLQGVRPSGYTAQNEESLVYRALDGNQSTYYQFVAWNSKATDDIPELSFYFNQISLQDIWIRNGRQTSEPDYEDYARIRRMDVDIYTVNGRTYHWEYRLEDLYDPYSVSSGWNYGYQRVALPQTVSGITQIDLWIRGWYRGAAQASQYKLCITDILFESLNGYQTGWTGTVPPGQYIGPNDEKPGDDAVQNMPTTTRTPVPAVTAAPARTPVPAYTPVPSGGSNQGIRVRLNQRMATRSGPGTQYTELGSYLQAGDTVTALSAAYDSRNGIWWVQTEFTYGGQKRRAYTGLKRLDMMVSQVQVEFLISQDVEVSRAVYAYYGPGYGYTMYPEMIPAGTEGSVWQTEAGYAQLEYYNAAREQYVRVWVPQSCLSESNG